MCARHLVCVWGFPDFTKLRPPGDTCRHSHRHTETVSKPESLWAQRRLDEPLCGLLISSRNWQPHLQWDFSSSFFPWSLKFPETKPFKPLLNGLRKWIKTPNGKCWVGTTSAAGNLALSRCRMGLPFDPSVPRLLQIGLPMWEMPGGQGPWAQNCLARW